MNNSSLDSKLYYEAKIKELQQKEKELYRANRGLRVLSLCNEVLVHATEESRFLHEICRILVEVGGYRMVWIGFAEHDEYKTVHPVAQAGFEDGYLNKANITWAQKERGLGPTGTAIREGRPCILRNILDDPNYKPWFEEASKRGYKSSIALPFVVDSRIFGALNIYSSEQDAFNDNEVMLLTELTNDLAYGVMTLRMRLKEEEAEKKLKETKSTLLEAQRIAHIGNWDWNIITNELSWSDEIYRIFGLKPNEFGATYEAFLNFVHPKDREFVKKSVNDALEKKLPYNIDHYIVLPNGIKRIVHEQAEVTFDENNHPIRMFGTVQDITELRLVEERGKESEEKYRNISENISSAIAVFSAINEGEDFVFEDFNKAAEKIDNIKKEKLLGKVVTEIFPGIKEFGLFEVLKRVWKTGVPEHHPISYYKDKRMTGWRESFVYKLTTGEIVALYDDLTEHKRQEQLLQESEQWLMTTLTSIADAVIATDVTGNIKFMNPIAESLIKLSKEEAVGNKFCKIYNILDENKDEMVENHASKFLKEGAGTGFIYETILIAKDGTKIPIEESWAPIRDEKGNFIGTILIFRDITARKRIEEELKKYHEHLEELVRDRTAELEKMNEQLKNEIIQRKLAEEGLKQFVYSVSHELRTPISVLIQSLSNLEDYEDKLSKELKEKLMQSISKNSKILAELVEDLLLASRMDGKQIELKWDMCSPLSIIRDVLEQMEPRFKIKEMNIKLAVNKDIQLICDIKRLGQIFRILIDNAIKYSNERTTIRIKATNNYKGKFNPHAIAGVLIQISDEGIGIKNEELPNVFKRFFRSDDVRNISGSGLGLSIA